jgi:hypothetical protein
MAGGTAYALFPGRILHNTQALTPDKKITNN